MSKYKTKDDEREIIPDGATIRVSILAMDSTQRQIASQPALDQRVRENLRANQFTLDRMRRNADKVQAHVDHFTAQQQQVDDSAYARFCSRIESAYREAV